MPTIQTIIEEEIDLFDEKFGSHDPKHRTTVYNEELEFLRASLTRVASEARQQGTKEAIDSIPQYPWTEQIQKDLRDKLLKK